ELRSPPALHFLERLGESLEKARTLGGKRRITVALRLDGADLSEDGARTGRDQRGRVRRRKRLRLAIRARRHAALLPGKLGRDHLDERFAIGLVVTLADSAFLEATIERDETIEQLIRSEPDERRALLRPARSEDEAKQDAHERDDHEAAVPLDRTVAHL